PALDLTVGLRIKRGSSDVRHAGEADEFLEIAGDELRTIVGDDPRVSLGKEFFIPLQDQFNVGFSHGGPDVPVNDATAEAIENAAEIVEGAAQIQIGDVHVPMLMQSHRRVEPASLLGRARVPARETAGSMEHPPDGSGTNGHDIGIE